MATEHLEHSKNPEIEYSGKAHFGKNHFCLWDTKDGSTATCTIQNLGKANTLTFVVSGAPATMKTTDGKDFNGKHSLPPNNPTHNITVVGKFTAEQITIFNISSLPAECSVNVVTAQGQALPSTQQSHSQYHSGREVHGRANYDLQH